MDRHIDEDMDAIYLRLIVSVFGMVMLCPWLGTAQIGTRFPSERKIVKDPITGIDLVFLTSIPNGDSKIYQTHNQWTADGQWLIFRSDRVPGEAIAVHEESGEMVLLSSGHKTTAADHPHPTFSPDGSRIQIQSAMLSEDNRTMNICIIPVPKHWLERTYSKDLTK